MRSKKQIMEEAEEYTLENTGYQFILEVLIDIRDLLKKKRAKKVRHCASHKQRSLEDFSIKNPLKGVKKK